MQDIPQGAQRPFHLPKKYTDTKTCIFGVKPHGEQRLLKSLCPLWEGLVNFFEKKSFGLHKIMNLKEGG